MLIIHKERIFFVFLALIISVLTYQLFAIKKTTVETISLPVSGKTIVLDAGHGNPDEGNYLLTLINNN